MMVSLKTLLVGAIMAVLAAGCGQITDPKEAENHSEVDVVGGSFLPKLKFGALCKVRLAPNAQASGQAIFKYHVVESRFYSCLASSNDRCKEAVVESLGVDAALRKCHQMADTVNPSTGAHQCYPSTYNQVLAKSALTLEAGIHSAEAKSYYFSRNLRYGPDKRCLIVDL